MVSWEERNDELEDERKQRLEKSFDHVKKYPLTRKPIIKKSNKPKK